MEKERLSLKIIDCLRKWREREKRVETKGVFRLREIEEGGSVLLVIVLFF